MSGTSSFRKCLVKEKKLGRGGGGETRQEHSWITISLPTYGRSSPGSKKKCRDDWIVDWIVYWIVAFSISEYYQRKRRGDAKRAPTTDNIE